MSATQGPSENDHAEQQPDGRTGGDDESLAVSLFAEIAEHRADTEQSPVQLYDHIDPEALGQLLTHARTKAESDWTLTFTVEDVTVTVTSDGEFVVR